MDKRIFEALDSIHAEEALKQNTSHFLRENMQKQAVSLRPLRFKRLIVIMAYFLLLSSATFSALYFSPKAYIDIDVNPSLAITVNPFGRVIDASAYNDDGQSILREVDIKNKSYDQTIQLLFQTMIDYGYMEQEDIISVTLQTNDGQKEATMLNHLESTVSSTLNRHHVHAPTEVYAVSNDVLKSAHEHHLSPARYIAITELQEVDERASYDTCAGHSLRELRQEKNAHANRHYDSDEDRAGNRQKERKKSGCHHAG
jgi:hypothetical protein